MNLERPEIVFLNWIELNWFKLNYSTGGTILFIMNLIRSGGKMKMNNPRHGTWELINITTVYKHNKQYTMYYATGRNGGTKNEWTDPSILRSIFGDGWSQLGGMDESQRMDLIYIRGGIDDRNKWIWMEEWVIRIVPIILYLPSQQQHASSTVHSLSIHH